MSGPLQYEPHALVWTPDKIARFWDFASQNTAVQSEYFTRQVGDALLRIARRHGALQEPVLDYGAGIGGLTERLLAAGLRVLACDFSEAAVAGLRQRWTGHPGWLGGELLRELPSRLAPDAYGTVFLLETLEHLLPDWRAGTLQEIYRVLKPGGRVIVTVPHAENLEAAQVLCPDCGARFHRVQHVASFDAPALSALMAGHGFAEVLCQPLDLMLWTDAHQRPLRRLRRGARQLLVRLGVLSARPASRPNLVYIGGKE